MTAQADPYSRFYWRFRDEYAAIYADKETYGWWMTLLANAEGAHPSAAELPRRIKARCLSALVDAELVELLPGERYRLKGVAAEMERRSKQGKAGADARWQRPQSDRNANALRPHSERTANGMPKQDETRRAETKRDATNAPASITLPVKGMDGSTVEVSVTGGPSSDALRLMKLAQDLTGIPYAIPHVDGGLGAKAMNEQVLPHGFDRTESAWRKIAAQVTAAGTSKPTVRQLVLGADDILNPVPHRDDKAEREVDAQAAYDRRVEKTRRQIAEYQN